MTAVGMALPEAERAASDALARIEGWARAQAAQREVDLHEGRVRAVREQGGGACAYAYDARGDLAAIDEPGTGTTRFRYDIERRLVEVVETDGNATCYAYDERGALCAVSGDGPPLRVEYDGAGRVARRYAGNAGCAVYRYDESGRLASARTATITTEYAYDADGRVALVAQTRDGVRIEARFAYDAAGRPQTVTPPGGGESIAYRWDERGFPADVRIGARAGATFAFDGPGRTARIAFSNGVECATYRDPVDARPLRAELTSHGEPVFTERFAYDGGGAIVSDGERTYAYDAQGRIARAGDDEYAYDARDNVLRAGARTFAYDARDRLLHMTGESGARTEFEHDACGRLTRRRDPSGETAYRYDDGGRLREVLRDAVRVAAFEYDHDDRLARAQSAGGAERYLYGPAGELLAVTGDDGSPLRLIVRTPLGILAEVHGALKDGEIAFHHDDRRGSCRAVTDAHGRVVAAHRYDAFGLAQSTGGEAHLPSYTTQRWYAQVGLYWFGTRWYDPELRRFLTPDTYTARPDDARLVRPGAGARGQAAARMMLLDDWLRRPRLRNRYALCGNDPVNASDPDGHWSFGGFVLSLLGAIWTLPNTVAGLLIEITCLVGEVLRWIVWLVTLGHVSWQTPGFDAASSSRLNAFALVFRGGWFGSIGAFTGITFGNVVFTEADWEQDPRFSGAGDYYPTAYGGTVAIPRAEAFYEHELRHTNQYGWLGPFFHLGLPIWGAYEWDWILSGFDNRQQWFERDATEHGGV